MKFTKSALILSASLALLLSAGAALAAADEADDEVSIVTCDQARVRAQDGSGDCVSTGDGTALRQQIRNQDPAADAAQIRTQERQRIQDPAQASLVEPVQARERARIQDPAGCPNASGAGTGGGNQAGNGGGHGGGNGR